MRERDILLPLAEATAISFTAPFFAVLLSFLLFREQIGIYRWGAVTASKIAGLAL